MMNVMIDGVLTSDPKLRESKTGGPFLTANMRAAGDDRNLIWVSVIAFDAATVEAMAALKKGDAATLVGPASIKTWEQDGAHRVSLSVTACRALSVNDAKPKKAIRRADESGGYHPNPGPTGPSAARNP